jgi:hypothetical protein
LGDALACERYDVTVSLMIFCYHANEAHGFRMGPSELGGFCAVAAADNIQQDETLSAATFIGTFPAVYICCKRSSYKYI